MGTIKRKGRLHNSGEGIKSHAGAFVAPGIDLQRAVNLCRWLIYVGSCFPQAIVSTVIFLEWGKGGGTFTILLGMYQYAAYTRLRLSRTVCLPVCDLLYP